VLRRLREAVPWWRRAVAVVAPLSLLDRARVEQTEPRDEAVGTRL